MKLCGCGRELKTIYSPLPQGHDRFHTIQQLICVQCGVRKIKQVSKTGDDYI